MKKLSLNQRLKLIDMEKRIENLNELISDSIEVKSYKDNSASVINILHFNIKAMTRERLDLEQRVKELKQWIS
jgi:hypothetical protein